MRLAIAISAGLLALYWIVLGWPQAVTRMDHGAIDRPIIAQLFANPEQFAGRKIEIYGLVVESNIRNEFFLQDVSQRSLRVLGAAAVGDQLTVIGKINLSAQSLYLTAEQIIPTKVTGGGGCC